MRTLGRVGLFLLFAAAIAATAGCTSTASSSGPRIFPDSAKRSGHLALFGSSAVRLDVYPLDSTQPVRTPCLLVASVLDAKGQPLKGRRIDWTLDGVGQLAEIDEGGLFPWIGRKKDNKQATTYTDHRQHRIKRGSDPKDDVIIRPGQSWIIVNSAVEGETAITVHAPSISDKEKNRAYVNCRWLDAGWRFPAPVAAAQATEQTLTTSVFRLIDQQPLGNYRVRYRVLDGPQAIFLQSRAAELVTVTDARGNATVSLVQMTPQPGTNRIGIEIFRPADAALGGSGAVIARSETRAEWLTPALELKHSGPASVGIGQEIPYTISVTNKGRVDIFALTLTHPLPEELDHVRSDPPAIVHGKQLVWTLGKLPPGQTHLVKLLLRSTRPGSVRSCVAVRSAEGVKDEQCVTTQVAQPGVKVAVQGPAGGAVGQALSYQITVSNPTPVPVTNAVVVAKFDPGLKHDNRAGASDVNVKLGTLAPNEVRNLPPLTLTPQQAGKQMLRVKVHADGNLTDETEHTITAQQAQLAVQVLGPKTRYVGLPAEWEIKVTNTGDAAVSNVTLRSRLPGEVRYERATLNGQHTKNGDVVWSLGTLAAQESKSVVVVTRCEQSCAAATHLVTVSADPGLTVSEKAEVEVVGIAAFRIKLKDDSDPVQVGQRLTYRVEVTNTGSLHADQVEIKAILPPELQLVTGGAKGPSAPTVDGETITFAKVNGHQPGRTLQYTIEVEAKQAGDARFRIELRSSALQQPVLRMESTQIYEAIGP